MKAFNTVMKVLTALAAVAGAVYVVATYGDKIVAWAKELCQKYGYRTRFYDTEDASSEEAVDPAQEPAAEEPAEEAPAEAEVPADPDAPVEEDFEN